VSHLFEVECPGVGFQFTVKAASENAARLTGVLFLVAHCSADAAGAPLVVRRAERQCAEGEYVPEHRFAPAVQHILALFAAGGQRTS
jgi:hypothetical protein